MIPLRITVEGFLSYRDRQSVCFEDHALWMLAGANGSGKSSLFDAVTFALYNHHRGGVTGAEGLINKHCDQLLVEFEFELDGQNYLTKRTLKRDGKSTRSISQWNPEKDDWQEIEQTSTKTGHLNWVVDNE